MMHSVMFKTVCFGIYMLNSKVVGHVLCNSKICCRFELEINSA
jgi:hypothetical protein